MATHPEYMIAEASQIILIVCRGEGHREWCIACKLGVLDFWSNTQSDPVIPDSGWLIVLSGAGLGWIDTCFIYDQFELNLTLLPIPW